jgi:glutaredoxin
MNWNSYSKKLIFCVALCFAMSANALDFGNMIQGVMNNRSSDLMNMAIKSVTNVSSGRTTAGAQAPANSAGQVILYRTSWCGYCKQAAGYMQQRNIPFVERDIEANSAYKAEYARMGGTGPVPYIVFGTQTMTGFSQSAFDSNYTEFQRTQNYGRPAPTYSTSSNGGRMPPSNANFPLQSGDTLVSKISGIRVYTQPSKASESLSVVTKSEEMIYMGEEREGLYRVTTTKGEGWVDKLLVRNR